MGYRSDVMAVFYTYEPNEFPSIKLFIDEHVPEWFKDSEYMSTFSHKSTSGADKYLSGIKFSMNGLKWYTSYSDVQGFERMIDKFDALCEGGNKWVWEFIRIGEEAGDVEERCSYESQHLIYVVRSIESDC
jgi:hypothetical protein